MPPATEPLATSRLALTPLHGADAAEMVGVLADPALYDYTGGAPPTPAELEARCARQTRGRAPTGGSGGSTGSCDSPAVRRSGSSRPPSPSPSGCLTEHGVGTLLAYIRPDHAASTAVARALGMAPGDTRRAGEVRWWRSADDPDTGIA